MGFLGGRVTPAVILAVAAAAVLLVNAMVMVKMLLILDSMKLAAELVARNLAVAQTAVEGVATDLDAAHRRANDAIGPSGAAADAASQTAPPPGE